MAQDPLQDSNARGPQGKYQPKYPVDKPLLHEEMDFNLDLIGQVIKGYRVMGTNSDGSLNLANDVEKVLKLYKVTSDDTTLINAGAKIDDYVWVPSTVEGISSDTVTLNDVTANIEAGAINIGDTVPAGSTLQDIVEQLLLTTYNPTFNNPSFSLSDNVANLQEIGNIIDINLTFNFNRGTIKGDLVDGTWVPSATQNHRAGVASAYTINGVTQPGNTLQITDHLVVEGDNTFQGSVAYLEGPQPLDSNGNNYSSPLPAETSPNLSTSFEGVYPIFLGNSSGSETKRALVSHRANNIVCEQNYDETSQLRHTIAIPNNMIDDSLVGFQQLNTVSNNFENLVASEFTATPVTKTVQGNSVNYTLYTKASKSGGPAQYKIIFN